MIIKRWNSNFTLARSFVRNGTTTLSGGNTKDLVVGAVITGTGILTGTTIVSITNATSLVMSNASTANGTSELTFTGVFNEQYPKTVAQKIYTNNGVNTIFDSNDKVKLEYLPNAVYDSLYYFSNASAAGALYLRASDAIINAASLKRSPLGYYWVVTTAGTLTANNVVTMIGDNRIATYITGGEEDQTGAFVTSVDLEVGDWFVISKIVGDGTLGDPYIVTFAVVNNTYEIMTGATSEDAGAPGIVPTPSAGDQVKFLRGDGTWVVPTDTNTTYSGSTSITLNGTSFEREALTGDVTASANSNATTIANEAVTFAKIQHIATNTILGRNATGNGDVDALTASEVRAILNVADGATANVGTVTSVSGTANVVSVTNESSTPAINLIAGHADTVNPYGVKNVNTVLAGPGTGSTAGAPTFRALVAADIPTLNQNTTGTAANVTGTVAVANGGTGATSYTNGQLLIGNSTGNTLTKATLSAGTGIQITNGGGSITITNSSPNATHSGDVTGSGVLTIATGAVTNGKLATIASKTIKGRITTSAGEVEDLSAASVRSIIELGAPIYIQTATPTPTVANSLWYDIN
jgi:hypothetical protein